MIIYKYTCFIQKDFSKGTFHKSMVAQKFVKMDLFYVLEYSIPEVWKCNKSHSSYKFKHSKFHHEFQQCSSWLIKIPVYKHLFNVL